jgi:hypothetical protein
MFPNLPLPTHNNPIIQVLMQRDEMSFEEAVEYFQDFQEEVQELIAAGGISDLDPLLEEYFGLEPDYIFDFLGL